MVTGDILPLRATLGLIAVLLSVPAGATDFTWGSSTIRGVNLGGWLVLEPWITPSLFQPKPSWVVDEATYGLYWQQANITTGVDELQSHWSSWIVEGDIASIAGCGLNTLRIPIGYWAIVPLDETETFIPGAYAYLKQAVMWAQSYGLAVIIDLHGAPGSQNGFDNSGQKGGIGWFSNTTDVSRTVNAIDVLAAEFVASSYGSTVVGIELLNEPYPSQDVADSGALGTLRSYYQSGYSSVRARSGEIAVVLDEAFEGLEEWESFMSSPQYSRVSLDIHIYGMFDNTVVIESYSDHLATYCGWTDSLSASNGALWTFVGEFTPASTDCALWLNGRGTGARYDGTLSGDKPALTGSCNQKSGAYSDLDQDYVEFLGQSFETQTWVYEQASGWIAWTWKTEAAADWSFQDGLVYGWIPQPLTNKTHGQPCENVSLNGSVATGISSAASKIASASRILFLFGCWLM